MTPLRSALADLPHLRAVLTTGEGATSFQALLAAAVLECVPEPVSGDDMAVWLYTSGTTGGPKAAVHVHRNLLACRHYGVDVLQASERDRAFATSKLFFAYALGNALLIPLYVGAPTYLDPAWPEPARVLRVLQTFEPTLFFSVPTFYGRLLRADLPADAFRSARACVSAGERLPPELYFAWRKRFGVELLDGFGASETIFMVLANRPGRSRAGSAGQPVPGTEARLLDAEGRAAADGEPGVLHVRTPSSCTAYWNRIDVTRRAFAGEWFRTGDVLTRDAEGRAAADGEPGVLHVRTPSSCTAYWNRIDVTRRAFAGEWFRTGDVLTRDAEGFYYHNGRDDERFKVAGQWVVPDDVEAVLRSHPDVIEAGVVSAIDAGGLLKTVAFVVPRSRDHAQTLAETLVTHAAARLPTHQRPRQIRVVGELPRTVTGKLQRYVLREWAEHGP
jgi:acyl-coenzyme A synthetase/AMP-(fatty) acid ligase